MRFQLSPLQEATSGSGGEPQDHEDQVCLLYVDPEPDTEKVLNNV